MAYVNSGTQRTLNISVVKHGDDNSSNTILLDGKLAFGAFAAITEDAMQKLSDADFNARVAAWQTYLETTYATSEPNMYANISGSFKYLKGVVVRLIATGIRKYKITTYPFIVEEAVTVKLEDPFDNIQYTLTIPIGSHTSNECTFSVDSTTTDQDIDGNYNYVLLQTAVFGTYTHYSLCTDVGAGGPTQYPIPV